MDLYDPWPILTNVGLNAPKPCRELLNADMRRATLDAQQATVFV